MTDLIRKNGVWLDLDDENGFYAGDENLLNERNEFNMLQCCENENENEDEDENEDE